MPEEIQESVISYEYNEAGAAQLYKKVTESVLPYEPRPLFSTATFVESRGRPQGPEFLTNSDPFTGMVKAKPESTITPGTYNNDKVTVVFKLSDALDDSEDREAFIVQRVNIYAGTPNHPTSLSRVNILHGDSDDAVLHYQYSYTTKIPANEWTSIDLSSIPAFNEPTKDITIVFRNNTTSDSVIAVGEVVLFGARALDESLDRLKIS